MLQLTNVTVSSPSKVILEVKQSESSEKVAVAKQRF